MKSKFSTFILGFSYIVTSYLNVINLQPLDINNGKEKDKESLKKDWSLVGQSLRGGINEFKSSEEYSKFSK
ncbi:MAG: hypothetical protein ACRC6K_06800 [Fusobacteriaceae bacterium]